jgi:hypothetical protein
MYLRGNEQWQTSYKAAWDKNIPHQLLLLLVHGREKGTFNKAHVVLLRGYNVGLVPINISYKFSTHFVLRNVYQMAAFLVQLQVGYQTWGKFFHLQVICNKIVSDGHQLSKNDICSKVQTRTLTKETLI